MSLSTSDVCHAMKLLDRMSAQNLEESAVGPKPIRITVMNDSVHTSKPSILGEALLFYCIQQRCLTLTEDDIKPIDIVCLPAAQLGFIFDR